MQVLLHTDPNTDGRSEMADHLASAVKDALGRFGDQVTRVEAHLSDANSHSKTGPGQIHCTLEAKLVGVAPVVVKDHADSAHQAIHAAIGKLVRGLTTALAKHEPRRGTATPAAPEPETATDAPD